MLLFIEYNNPFVKASERFQYISCYSLSYTPNQIDEYNRGFNTSHVTLYPVKTLWKFPQLFGFNTSHVTLYPESYSCYLWYGNVSIHLMLLFIGFGRSNILLPKSFQYISCYSLSVLSICLTYKSKCFNTSHVTLYHILAVLHPLHVFCFNTSHVTLYLCPQVGQIVSFSCFNTSHVTLYRSDHSSRLWNLPRFNTSHVTLYQKHGVVAENHLMFQYISCYSLSRSYFSGYCNLWVSIHLMLLFI